jgi:glycosyltransferase involved in cell wall biosynthesis
MSNGFYNAERFIASTLDSVLSQTITDFEVIVVNDGSTDATSTIVEQYIQRDDRIRLVNQINQGVCIARTLGQVLSRGEFIIFLDADDIWLPHNLAAHIQHFTDTPDLGISFGRVEFISQDGRSTSRYSNSRLSEIQPHQLFYENLLVTPSNAVIRRSVLEHVGGFSRGFTRNMSGVEDQELFLRACYFGWKVEGINQVLVQYRISLNGLSAQLQRMEDGWLKLQEIVQSYAPDLVQQHARKSYAYCLRSLARRSLRIVSDRKTGLRFMLRALRLHWQLLIEEPRRTGLTLLAVILRVCLPN